MIAELDVKALTKLEKLRLIEALRADMSADDAEIDSLFLYAGIHRKVLGYHRQLCRKI